MINLITRAILKERFDHQVKSLSALTISQEILNLNTFGKRLCWVYLYRSDFVDHSGLFLLHLLFAQNPALQPCLVQLGSLLSWKTKVSAHHLWMTQKMMTCFSFPHNVSRWPDNACCCPQNSHLLCHNLLEEKLLDRCYLFLPLGKWGLLYIITPFSKLVLFRG